MMVDLRADGKTSQCRSGQSHGPSIEQITFNCVLFVLRAHMMSGERWCACAARTQSSGKCTPPLAPHCTMFSPSLPESDTTNDDNSAMSTEEWRQTRPMEYRRMRPASAPVGSNSFALESSRRRTLANSIHPLLSLSLPLRWRLGQLDSHEHADPSLGGDFLAWLCKAQPKKAN